MCPDPPPARAVTATADDTEFRALLDRLSDKATADYYNPFTTFDWPAAIPTDELWMSPELLSLHGTELMDELNTTQLHALSRWESVNFYSLNVHGIRELLIEVTRRVHTPGFELPSEFFHHFIGEENDHMWFFATFCLKYAGKIYPDKSGHFPEAPRDPDIENFLVFARILIFEQIVDHYNVQLAADSRLHPTVRHINRLHHQDESRHIAFGCRLVQLLWERLLDRGLDDSALHELRSYLGRYLTTSVESLYNPAVYRDAGIPDGFALRKRLLTHPARQAAHAKVLQKTTSFLNRIGVLDARH
ncbi:P-aminobenzoate N-oxygenase AurF [Streptomyces sp. LamerLS-316]|uniref:diiron oxygenase n=1 Tax=Streptomyces sp. LamerLS-316 TaxID=1157630 RepID=UPI000823B83D|nr:diiron oxygenase [Streptomyces sp. LamerLS-316]MYQ40754.1 AurF domain containing protein [Streptomyces sp. SID4921]SCK05220.1 P-aminobenzoate N-oxygenase AurF [Streptomyces sp. LamerLS-316]